MATTGSQTQDQEDITFVLCFSPAPGWVVCRKAVYQSSLCTALLGFQGQVIRAHSSPTYPNVQSAAPTLIQPQPSKHQYCQNHIVKLYQILLTTDMSGDA